MMFNNIHYVKKKTEHKDKSDIYVLLNTEAARQKIDIRDLIDKILTEYVDKNIRGI